MEQSKSTRASLTRVKAAAILDVQGLASLAIKIVGTFVGTVIFEYTINGTDWDTLTVNIVGSATTATGATAVGKWKADVAGFQAVKIRCTAFTSGSIDVTLRGVLESGGAISDATAAKQDTGNTSLASIDGKTIASVIASATQEIIRPSDVTAYAALDTIGTSLAITGATNASPIVITCATHGLVDGDPVTIASVGGNTNANTSGFAKVTGYSTTTFGLYSDKALTTPIAGNSAYTSGGTVFRLFRFANLARIVNGSGYIVKAQLATDQKTATARFRLHLFKVAPTAIADNSPYLTLYANIANRVGVIDFPAASTEDATNSTQAYAQLVPGSGNLPLPFVSDTADQDLYGILETLDAFTPASGQKITIKLSADQN